MFYDQLSNDKEFADWILASVDLLVIDEAQDLNESNFMIFNRLLELKPAMKLFLVGDPRQNIFEFNGGSYEHLNKFLSRYQDDVALRNLSVSYRCPESVLGFVNSFSFIDCENIPLRSDVAGSIRVISFPDTRSESESIIDSITNIGDLDTCAVVSPNIKGLSDIIECLNNNSIPYVVFGGKRKLKSHIKFINNLLRILYNYNEKGILSVCRVLKIDVKTQPVGAPRHFSPKELFFRNSYGRQLREIQKEYDRLEWKLPVLIDVLVDKMLPSGMYSEPEIADDYRKLKSIVSGYKTIKEYLDAFTVDKERFICFYDKDFVDSITETDGPCLTLSTIHSAKGLEWKHVFLIGMYDLNFPGIKKYSNKTIEKQERYLNTKKKELYVACTRASQQLRVSFPLIVEDIEQTPSRLLTGMTVDQVSR
jgi:DNA helicase-2/ATP-dependent DNA helicase PcrA